MGERIALVVDDSKSARFALRKYLEAHAFRVDTADSARAAYAWLQDQRPDLIFLDHVMPGEDGFSALQHIQDDPQTAGIPVVICSSNEGGAFVAEARSRGAADVLAKPPSPDQLRRVLEQVEAAALQAPPAAPEAPAPAAAPTASAAPAADAAGLGELRGAVDLLRADLATASDDGAQITQALEARASAIESRLGAIEQRLGSDLSNARKHLEEQIETLRARHEAALETLRDEQRQAIDALLQQRAQEQEAQRRQFDVELRAVHEQLREELARAIQAAREQTLQDFRTRLLAALGD